MEATILKLLDISKQFVEDSKSPKLSDKIVTHYYTLSEPAKQLHFKDALIQQLHSFSTVNDFTNFSHLLYAALAIKPPNLDGVLYKFLINQKQLNQTFEGHNPNQLCLKILSQIPVNPIYVNNINQFFKNKVDESIGLHLFHFYAVNHLHDESLSVLNTICDKHFYIENAAVLSFQLFTSLKYLEPEIFEVWFQSKLELEKIPVYVLKVLRKTFERAHKKYHEYWKSFSIRFIEDIDSMHREIEINTDKNPDKVLDENNNNVSETFFSNFKEEKNTHPDQKYIDGIRNNDSILIKEIHKKFYPVLKNFILKNSGTINDAKDLFQEALTIIWENVNSENVVLQIPFGAYFYRIYRNKWLSSKRYKGRNNLEFSVKEYEDSFSEYVDGKNLKERRLNVLHECFKKLSEDCQKMLNLESEGKKASEIQEILNKPSKNSVFQTRFRCRVQLKKLIEAHPDFDNLNLK